MTSSGFNQPQTASDDNFNSLNQFTDFKCGCLYFYLRPLEYSISTLCARACVCVLMWSEMCLLWRCRTTMSGQWRVPLKEQLLIRTPLHISQTHTQCRNRICPDSLSYINLSPVMLVYKHVYMIHLWWQTLGVKLSACIFIIRSSQAWRVWRKGRS